MFITAKQHRIEIHEYNYEGRHSIAHYYGDIHNEGAKLYYDDCVNDRNIYKVVFEIYEYSIPNNPLHRTDKLVYSKEFVRGIDTPNYFYSFE